MRVVTNSLLAFMFVGGAGLLSIAQSWAYGPTDITVRQRALALFWPHLVILALLGLFDLGALSFSG
jgi:hypothetical protein